MSTYDNKFWTTLDGRKIKLKHLSDEHLANIIFHTGRYTGYPSELKHALLDIAYRRGLTVEFIKQAPFPYKNSREEIIVWDYDLDREVVLA